MFAVGHLGLGYLLGSASSRLSSVDVNVSYLFLLSILPDVDLVTRRFGLQHRGQTHSLVLFSVVFLPLFLVFRRKAFPYFVALFQHTLIGDLLTGNGVQLFWPLSSDWYEIRLIGSATGITNITVEWVAFLASMLFLFKLKDIWFFAKPHKSNLVLSIPLAFVSFSLLTFAAPFLGFPRILHYFDVPAALIIPHVAFFLLFTLAILVDLGLGAKVLVKRAMLKSSSTR